MAITTPADDARLYRLCTVRVSDVGGRLPGVGVEVHVAAKVTEGVFADEAHQRRRVVAGVQVVEAGEQVVLLPDVLERIIAGSTGSCGGAVGIIGVLREQVAVRVSQRHHRTKGIGNGNRAVAAGIGALEEAGAAVPEIGHLGPVDLLCDRTTVISKSSILRTDELTGDPAK